MTNFVWAGSFINAATVYNLDIGDSLLVAPGAFLASTDAACIVADGGNNIVRIAGSVAGIEAAVRLGLVDAPVGTTGNNVLTVEQGGSIYGLGTYGDGVSLSGNDNSVINAGTIAGDFGIVSGFFDSNRANNAMIVNDGQIQGSSAGIVTILATTSVINNGLISSAEGLGQSSSANLGDLLGGICAFGTGVTVTNTGTISSASNKGYGIAVQGDATLILNSGVIQTNSIDPSRAAVDLITADGESAKLTNTATGHITSFATAIQGDAGAETIINHGEVVGDVLLGGGNDSFDSRGGSILGLISTEDGDDWVRGGGSNNDIDGGRGDDNLAGNAGEDTIRGGRGRDILYGGDDADMFVFANVLDSQTGASKRDVIRDFVHAVDQIDLSLVDADDTTGGNQNFTFIGSDTFSAPGQVRYDTTTGILSVNTDSDLAAEMQIRLVGLPVITTVDLIL